MSYGNYVEQLTCLLFLKIADERRSRRTSRPASSPAPLIQALVDCMAPRTGETVCYLADAPPSTGMTAPVM